MKYVCKICGYVYDEETEGINFSELPADWTCPLCGAAKGDFAPKQSGMPTEENLVEDSHQSSGNEHLQQISIGQLAAICSNLARGCEKQYKTEEQSRFLELANYFDSITPAVSEGEVADILALLKNDLNNGYPALNQAGTVEEDRGALRVKVWGEKVTMIQKSILERYEKEGEKFLENTNVWICTVCGFLYVGEKAPQICPVCKVPDWKFEKVTGR